MVLSRPLKVPFSKSGCSCGGCSEAAALRRVTMASTSGVRTPVLTRHCSSIVKFASSLALPNTSNCGSSSTPESLLPAFKCLQQFLFERVGRKRSTAHLQAEHCWVHAIRVASLCAAESISYSSERQTNISKLAGPYQSVIQSGPAP